MTETESPDLVSAESSHADEPAAGASTAEPAQDADSESYRVELAELVVEEWAPPRRGNNVQPRIAVATVFLGPRGRLVRWTWRRRSPNGRFNDSIADHLNSLVDAPRQFPLPPEDSDLRTEVLQDGVAIQFADDDA